MADHFLYERIHGLSLEDEGEGAVEKAPARMSTLRLAILGVLALVLVAELVWFCVIVPLLPLASIRINGMGLLDRGQVLERAGILGDSSWFSVDVSAVEGALSSLALVETVSVNRRFPDTLTIDIVERSAVAVLVGGNPDAPLLLSMDRDGVVFNVERPSSCRKPALLSAVPLLSGIVFEYPEPGVRLPDYLVPLVASLGTLSSELPALMREVSEIQVFPKDGNRYELVLCPVRAPVRFRIGSLLNRDTLTYMMFMLDVLEANGIETDVVDLRTGSAVYVPKEGTRGQ